MHTRTWKVEIRLTEDDGTTKARAELQSESGATRLTGHGQAQVSPRDPDVPEIGDELAASRALKDLAHQLLETTAEDISDLTHEDVVLDH